MKIVLSFSLVILSLISNAQLVSLDWTVVNPKTDELVDLCVGSLQYNFYKQNLLPSPFSEMNEKDYAFFENQKWELNSTFNVDSALFRKREIVFNCKGIDTYAKIYLNNILIYEATNSFANHEFDLKQALKLGENSLKAVFTPPVLYHADRASKGLQYPMPNDIDSIKVAAYTRKPQYQFGWDWTGRMNTIGFIAPTNIIATDSLRVTSHNIQTLILDSKDAWMQLNLDFSELSEQTVIWKSKLFEDERLFVYDNRLERIARLQDVKLWWPRGHGEQNLYNDTWEIYSEEGKLLYTQEVRFGVKQSELRQNPDQYGTSYEIAINDEVIFAKGANFIPPSVFPVEITEDAIENVLMQAYNANFNMIRVWGGGSYATDYFMKRCDELGIMVWHDFMFACAMYPANGNFVTSLRDELQYNIPRISKHPSLVLWNGNNEVDVAWKNWGFQKQNNIHGADSLQIERDYNRLFKEIIPEYVSILSEIPYVHTSPLSNWGKPEFYNHGSQHYWGVWHGSDPLSGLVTNIGRFNAEYGFQSFPQLSVLNTLSDSEIDINSTILKDYQKSYVGNEMIKKHAVPLYGEIENLGDFVYKSQLTQAKAIGDAILGHRFDSPRCSGTLYWQLNDCWPSPTWSSVDFAGNKKALHYQVEKNYRSVAVVRKPNAELVEFGDISKDFPEFYILSDVRDTFYCSVAVEFIALDGKSFYKQDAGLFLKGKGNYEICLGQSMSDFKRENYVLRFTWTDNKNQEFSEEFLVQNKRQLYEDENLEKKAFTIEKEVIDGQGVFLLLTVKRYVQSLWITSNTQDFNLSQNFESYLPGKYVIGVNGVEDVELDQLKVHFLEK